MITEDVRHSCSRTKVEEDVSELLPSHYEMVSHAYNSNQGAILFDIYILSIVTTR